MLLRGHRGPRTTTEAAAIRPGAPPAVSTEERTIQPREHSRIAYCECGAQLAGESEQELFDAAQAHLAHHHPELLGAVGPRVVQQMAEERPGAITAEAGGAQTAARHSLILSVPAAGAPDRHSAQ